MPPATANSQHGLLWVSLAAFLWIYADAVVLTFQSMVRLSFHDLLIFHQHATAVSPRSHGHSDGELTFGSHANIQCQSPEPIQSSHVVLESCQTISSNNAIKCNKNKKNTTKPWSPKPCTDPWFQLSASRTSCILLLFDQSFIHLQVPGDHVDLHESQSVLFRLERIWSASTSKNTALAELLQQLPMHRLFKASHDPTRWDLTRAFCEGNQCYASI